MSDLDNIIERNGRALYAMALRHVAEVIDTELGKPPVLDSKVACDALKRVRDFIERVGESSGETT